MLAHLNIDSMMTIEHPSQSTSQYDMYGRSYDNFTKDSVKPTRQNMKTKLVKS